MKSFWERFSVTKLVLLLLVLALIFIEIYNVMNWGEIDQLFTDVLIAVVSFYFGQKWISYDEPDSLVEMNSKIWFDLDNNDEEDGGTD
jgi:hypothetical protein